ncbi:MAG: hypothetical protein K9M75_12295 [Phycisphaerae bacterium]|nr:hypothetical protein [Phycisphaerae bacterium]
MGGLRSKLLIALIIYFAGFGSAIYYQAPALDGSEIARHDVSEEPSSKNEGVTKGEVLAKKAHKDLLEFYSFAEEKASKVGALIKARIDEK